MNLLNVLLVFLTSLVLPASSSIAAAPNTLPQEVSFAQREQDADIRLVRTLSDFQQLSTQAGSGLDIRVECDVIDITPDVVTVRDSTATISINIETVPPFRTVYPGDHILIEGSGGTPMERIPDFPSHRITLPLLEEQSKPGAPFATRVRMYLRPPLSGEYRFWIASDDESGLFLSPDSNPQNIQRIAQVNDWTRATAPREWDKSPDQRSSTVSLQEGKLYYLEVLHRNVVGPSHWSVAWKGPGFERSVIGGRHITPFEGNVMSHALSMRDGALEERWTPYDIQLLSQFHTTGPLLTRPAKVENLTLTVLGHSHFGEPRTVYPGDRMSNDEYLPYVEVEGFVTRAENGFGQSSLELSWNGHKADVRVANPNRRSLTGLLGEFVRVRGFCNSIIDGSKQRIVGSLHSTSLDEISLSLPPSPRGAPDRPIYHPAELASPSAAVWAQTSFRSVGVLRRQANGSTLLEGEPLTEVEGYVSSNGVEWTELGRAQIPFSNDVHVGLAATSYSPDKKTEAVFQKLAGLKGMLQGRDLGHPAQAGSSIQSEHQWTIQAGGKDIWNDTQEGYFLSTRMNGDFEVSVRCESLKHTGEWAKAGLMIRERLSEGSPYALIAAVPQNLAMFQFRDTAHGLSSPVITTQASLPCWLKMRVRNLVSAIPIQPVSETGTLPEGVRVEVAGVLERAEGSVRLKDAFLRVMSATEKSTNPGGRSRTLRTVREIRQSTGSGQSYLVELRGIVTSPRTIQDDTGAIYLNDPITKSRGGKTAEPGDFVELVGTTRKDRSWVTVQTILTRVLGKGVMPEPKHFPWSFLVTGAADSQWIEQEGVVQSCGANSFELLVAGGLIEVINPWKRISLNPLQNLVGATVSVRGICWMDFDTEGRPARVRIVPPTLHDVNVGSTGPKNPFDAPPIEIGEMIRAAAVGPLRYRTVNGVVTYANDRTVYLQNESGAVRVDTMNPYGFAPGDNVEAAGIPFLPRQPLPYLAFANVRKIGPGTLPPALSLNSVNLDRFIPKAELITLEASVLETQMTGNGLTFTLSAGARIFHASLAGAPIRRLSLPEGTLVRLQGVCTYAEVPQILLQDAKDVLVLQLPARWRRERALVLITVLITFAALIILIGLLRSRRRLREQLESRRKAEAEFEAVEGERNRLATELHDTLEQSLTGVALRLLAASKSFDPNRESSRKHLEEARALLTESQLEVRRSVWNLRSKMLEDAGLPEALSSIGNQLASAANVKFTLQTEGRRMRLPEFLENHLLRIGQEAITNAVKHAGASEIEVQLGYAPDSIVLTVTDDGQGMNPTARLGKDGKGHFGLLGMKERASKIDGTLKIDSCSGRTMITVHAPAMEKSSSL